MAPGWKSALIRWGLLFLISLVLVAGFWFHREFYQIGLYSLLAIGGFATFLVIVATSWVLSGTGPARRARGDLVVPPAEAEAMSRRPEGDLILPAAADLPLPGMAVRVVTQAGASYGAARIVSAHRTILADLTAEDLRRTAYPDAAAFRSAWEARRPWRPDEPVTVLHVRRVGGKAA